MWRRQSRRHTWAVAHLVRARVSPAGASVQLPPLDFLPFLDGYGRVLALTPARGGPNGRKLAIPSPTLRHHTGGVLVWCPRLGLSPRQFPRGVLCHPLFFYSEMDDHGGLGSTP